MCILCCYDWKGVVFNTQMMSSTFDGHTHSVGALTVSALTVHCMQCAGRADVLYRWPRRLQASFTNNACTVFTEQVHLHLFTYSLSRLPASKRVAGAACREVRHSSESPHILAPFICSDTTVDCLLSSENLRELIYYTKQNTSLFVTRPVVECPATSRPWRRGI